MLRSLVLQSDFCLSDGAVSAMYGVATSVNPNLCIFDLTHDIPPFHIWEASYRLLQTVSYWPRETVFVSVVDPGVGSDRKSIVAKTVDNHYIITPDNGTISHMKDVLQEVRLIDEAKNRLPNSGESYTFYGRDRELVNKSEILYGNMVEVSIFFKKEQVFKKQIIFGRSFADAQIGESIAYINSLDNVGLAINQQSMANTYSLGAGADWTVQILPTR
ncbi:MAG: SAM-dependent chlorinase/fluorinase [Bacillus sp. (in: firmicutes)]